MNKRDVKDPLYGIGYKYNKRVFLVNPKGVTTVITKEEHQNMIHCRKTKEWIDIIKQGRPIKNPK